MTIEVKVTNADSRESAVISVEAVSADDVQPSQKWQVVELKGGESKVGYLHSGQQFVIKEVSE
jgi:hypothetical protein